MKSCLFVGVDTHKDSHTAAVLDGYFDVLATITFANDKAGFARLEAKLKKLKSGRELVFGLEDSQGLGSFLVSYLTGKGYRALEINPVLTDRGRKHTVSRDKSDEKDAIIIAKTLIRERSSLHPVRIDRNGVALREIVSSYHCLTSIPGIDIVTATRIISAVMDISRFSSASKLARFCGIAPSEKSAGRKKRYQKSKYGNKSLYSTIYFIALSRISRTKNGKDKNPISRAYYLKKVSEGKTKKEALTCFTRRLVDIIFAIMRDRSIYNFSKSRFTKQHDSLINTVAA